MHSSRDKKSDPFYKPPTSIQKTSAEIINEARNSLRTVRTQRPFTPREDQRKLFGPLSSRTQDNRPPSSFSLHACSFESSESRPVSGTRLNPLPHKPRFPFSKPGDDDISPPLPQPPLHPVLVRRGSASRTRVFRNSSQGNLVLEYGSRPEEGRKQQSPEEAVVTSKDNLDDSPVTGSGNSNLENNQEHQEKEGPYNPNVQSGCDSGAIKSIPPRRKHHSEIVALENKTGLESEHTLYETETAEEASYWDLKIAPILQDLEAAHQDRNVEDLYSICVKLHKCLEDGNILGKKCFRRSVILKTLYKLVELGSDKLGIRLSNIILSLKVSGKNLLNICKLIFKISRSENNDCLFQNDNIMGCLLEVLQNEDVQTSSEAFLYCMGAIKFLSGNTVLLNDLLRRQAVEILVALMRQINGLCTSPETGLSNMGHLLVQLTATLRNLADLPQSRSKILSSNALAELCALIEHFVCDKDICTNVSRIFSKLSSYSDCCTALAECSRCYPAFLSVLNKHPKKQDLVVRILFTLGNLTAKNNLAREQFYEQRGSIKTLLSLLHMYCELDMNSEPAKVTETEKTKDQKRPTETEDVLIKLIRVLANIAIYPAVGTHLAANQTCVALLMLILDYKSIDDCEELVINTIATINNLSYYQDCPSIVTDSRLQISELLLKILICNNMDAILETARVFGNLSHYQDVRDFIVERKVYKFMVALLDAKHQDVCFSACGVLINLMADSNKRALLKQEGGIKKLADCLRDFGPSDWQLAGLVCKAFWNFSENITEAELCFGYEETNTLLELLSTFLDEVVALDNRWNGDLIDYHKACWEIEFKPVATQLLERIRSHHSYLEPLPVPL
ncbi:armadillo repeat-containing protein 2 [Discoglossus pictus]